MHNDLKRVNGKKFQSYIGDNFPLYSETSYGQFIIIDNTGAENINGLVPNTYNIFVDHIHIASGYGFSTYDSFNKEVEKIAYSYNEVINLINQKEAEDNLSLFNIQINDTSNANHFGTYNAYGFETSYTNLSISTSESLEHKYNYQININKWDLNFIKPIEVEYLYDNNINKYITSVYKTQNFPINIKLEYNSIGDDPGFNSLLIHENVKINNKNISELQVVDTANSFTTYSFQFVEGNYKKDLVIDYLYDNEIISTYVIPNLLNWTEKILIYPTTDFINREILLNDTISNNDENDPKYIGNFINASLTGSLATINSGIIKNNTLYIEPNQLINVEFSSGTNFLYDYVVILHDIDIEFYFNGIKSNNWTIVAENIQDPDSPDKYYSILRSPQKYSGNHIWQIKINTNS